jgi:DNA repair protein RecO (recombination protein O)
MLKKDSAVCIRTVDYSETSQIVTFFTSENGKVSAIAKGSKRPKSPFDGPIEVLSHGRIVFSDTESAKLATLTEFQQQPTFGNLAKNLFALNSSLLAVELLNGLTDEHDPHPELFNAVLNFLKDINEVQTSSDERRDTLALLILFQLTLLKEIGLQPILNYCPNCKTRHTARGTQHEFYFSSEANGLVCRDCEANFPDKIPVTKAAGMVLYNLKTLAQAEDRTLKEIEKVLISHFTNTMGKQPKLAKHVLG